MQLSEYKKMYVPLGAVIFIGLLLLVRQIYLASVITIRQDNESVVSDATYPIPYTKDDPSYGNPGAGVIVAVFADLSCAKCVAPVTQLREFIRVHPRDIRLVWKDAPKNSIFHDTVLAHKAARCAFKQDKFWEYTDRIFGVSDNYKSVVLEEAARSVGLNMDTWSACLLAKETSQAVADNSTLSDTLKITTLPTIFINNKEIHLLKGISLVDILNQVISKQ
jgi:protein-disulfide isomerase